MISQLSFNVEAAKVHGVEGAVLLSHIVYWVCRNKANKKNEIDGVTWTYNSARSFQELFPFWNQAKIRRLLNKLEEENAIKIGCYNKASYDRTKWFSITNHTVSLYSKDYPNLEDASYNIEESIVKDHTMQSSKVDKQYQITNHSTKQITIKYPYETESFLELWDIWKQFRKDQHNFYYKSPATEQAVLNKLAGMSNTEDEARDHIERAIAGGWRTFYPKKETKGAKTFDTEKYRARLESLSPNT